jgi:adenine-specific DNA methylase
MTDAPCRLVGLDRLFQFGTISGLAGSAPNWIAPRMTYPKRLIEVDLPIKRISEHARREKSIRHGHISTLHIWWARRPLAACRAVICAALWPDPADESCPQAFRDAAKDAMRRWAEERTKLWSQASFPRFIAAQKNPAKLDDLEELRHALLDFIADFANWDNSTHPAYLETSRLLTQTAHEALGGIPGTRPLVVDPFAGGGSIPLEALRVGADAFASDLNPIPVLLNKVILEYIPKYGQCLADEVRKWGEWIKQEAEKELAEFYPKDPDGATPIAYLWARTIRCEGPGCGAEIPLFRSPYLAYRGKQSVYLKLKCNSVTKTINFEIGDSDVSCPPYLGGVLRRSSATCPICGYTTPAANVRNQFKGRKGGGTDARLLAVVTISNKEVGKRYRLPEKHDLECIGRASHRLAYISDRFLSDIPRESLPYLRSIFNIHLLDVTEWNHLFTPRQLASLTILMRLIRSLLSEIHDGDSNNKQLKEATITCLALAIDRVIAQFSSLSWWQAKGEFVVGTFGRQALGIIWDFAEIRPVGGASGDLDGAIDWIVRVIGGMNMAFNSEAVIQKASATSHPLPNNSASAVITDPPYYDAVPYADLSDYFYVFLKRMLSGIHPSLFSTELTEKNGEIVQLAERNSMYSFKTKEYFELGMRNALFEAKRVTIWEGICVIVFAHKTTQGWESMISSIINSGWIVTASWPIDTERAVRMRASSSAALASSVHLVCRPRDSDDIGDWRNILQDLPQRIHNWMPRLAAEGVVGADAIFACLGPALEIFSRYSKVEKANGDEVSLREYLEQVWAAVSKEALTMVFQGVDAGDLEEDARLTAMWLWTLSAGASSSSSVSLSEDEGSEDDDEEIAAKSAKTGGFVLEYDAARKIAQGLGAHLEDLKHLVEIKGDQARLLPVAERTRHLFGKEEAAETKTRKKKAAQTDLFATIEEVEAVSISSGGSPLAPKLGETALDRVHQAMILFATGRGEALKRMLVDDGAGREARFWKLAQALSALYPSQTEEKRWVDGVLARKKGLGF